MSSTQWTWLAIGGAFAGAAGLGLWWRRPPPDTGSARAAMSVAAADGAWAAGRDVAAGFPARGRSPDGGFPALGEPEDRAPRKPAPLPRVAGGAPAARPVSDEEVWAHYDPGREELEYRAFRAEREAEHELRNLLRVLDLDQDQQDRVFAALVRRSDYYHPALLPHGAGGTPIAVTPPSGGAPVPAPDPSAGPDSTPPPAKSGPSLDSSHDAPADPVLAELPPELSDVYERYTSERHAFWVGIVEDIEKELNSR